MCASEAWMRSSTGCLFLLTHGSQLSTGDFTQVDERFVAVLKLIADEGRDIRRHVEHEGQKTRRHFDVVAEQMKSERNLAIDKAIATDAQLTRLTATNAADHVSFDSRLNDLEKRRE